MLDTNLINAQEVTSEEGIHLGKKEAPVKVIEFLNLRCPYCKQWFEDSRQILQQYLEDGKIELIIKHFDKEKPGLKKGNVLHQYLDYGSPEKAHEDIAFFFEKQYEWGEMDEDGVAAYAENERELTRQQNQDSAQSIIEEAERAGITLVPTVIIGDHIFDESVTREELIRYIEES